MKERSLARNKKLEAERREHLTRKDIQQQAKEQIKREEKERKMRQKAEDDALQAEMVKIRKEMEEERRLLREQEMRYMQATKYASCVSVRKLFIQNLSKFLIF